MKTLLDQSIVEGLEMLGKDMPRVILFHVSRSKGIRREEVADRVEEFVDALEEIFGEGSAVLERLILERLNSKVGILTDFKGDWSLKDYVQLLNRKWPLQPYQAEQLPSTPDLQ